MTGEQPIRITRALAGLCLRGAYDKPLSKLVAWTICACVKQNTQMKEPEI